MKAATLRVTVALTWIAGLSAIAAGFTAVSQQQTPRQVLQRTGLSVANALETPQASTSSTAEVVEFPPPLTPVDRFKRAATFWSTAIPIVANYYGIIGKIKMQEVLGTKMSDEEVEVSSFQC